MIPLLNPARAPGDDPGALRPINLDQFVGQPQLRERVSIALESARLRNEPCDHLLLSGPPGTGKTTLANIVARSMGGKIIETSGPAILSPFEVASTLMVMPRGTVLFIDEIHRMATRVEEALYPAMEDHMVDVISARQARTIGSQPVRSAIQPFTLIGATTQPGRLTAPLRDRFGINLTFDLYPVEDLARIVAQSAVALGISVDAEGAMAIARAARGTPRIANRLLRRVRDYALVRASGSIDPEVVMKALAIEGINQFGLDNLDRQYLNTLATFYDGGPAGLNALAATMQSDITTLTEVIEPYLLHQGMVIRTNAGRKITPRGRRAL